MKKKIQNLLPYIIVIIFVILLRTFIITPIQVVGTSMMPNLENGELMLLNKFKYKVSDIKRFDIVVVNYPDKPLIKIARGDCHTAYKVTEFPVYLSPAT